LHGKSVPNVAAISLERFFLSFLCCARSGACLCRTFCCSVSGLTSGTAVGFPCSYSATNVKKAVVHTFRSPVINSSVTAFTNTSIDVLCVHVTNASTQIESPSFTGAKKSTESVEAVTTNSRACLTAAMAATSSICSINFPPNNVPCAFVSGGNTCDVFTVNELVQDFASIIITSIDYFNLL